jgi:hypothetical protein
MGVTLRSIVLQRQISRLAGPHIHRQESHTIQYDSGRSWMCGWRRERTFELLLERDIPKSSPGSPSFYVLRAENR